MVRAYLELPTRLLYAGKAAYQAFVPYVFAYSCPLGRCMLLKQLGGHLLLGETGGHIVGCYMPPEEAGMRLVGQVIIRLPVSIRGYSMPVRAGSYMLAKGRCCTLTAKLVSMVGCWGPVKVRNWMATQTSRYPPTRGPNRLSRAP